MKHNKSNKKQCDHLNELIRYYSNGEIPDFEFERLHYLAMTSEAGQAPAAGKPEDICKCMRVELQKRICLN